jgi:prophage regulatory protein
MKILRLPDVRGRTKLAKTQIYAQIKEGHFPKPVPLTVGGRAVGWLESEIDEWIEKRSKARDVNTQPKAA